jgi:hypothetical protein
VHAEFCGKLLHILAAVRFRQHDAVGFDCHQHCQIVVGQSGREIVDSDIDGGACLLPVAGNEAGRDAACRHLVLWRDGILEVDDDHVGAGAKAFLQLLFGIARHKQQRAHQAAFFIIIAWRVHLATSTSF